MKKLNQKGFTGFEISLLILVLALIGFAGYTVWQNNKPDKSSETTVVQKVSKSEVKPDPETPVEVIPDGWKKYDSNNEVSFIYPEKWSKEVKLEEFQNSHVFEVRYVGDITLNSSKNGWVHASTAYGYTKGATAEITKESRTDMDIWVFGFGDAGVLTKTPTFVVKDKIYQINTAMACDVDLEMPDCPTLERYESDYKKLVESIKIK